MLPILPVAAMFRKCPLIYFEAFATPQKRQTIDGGWAFVAATMPRIKANQRKKSAKAIGRASHRSPILIFS